MFIHELNKYDGKLIHQPFAYHYFRNKVNPLGDIILFRGKMEVLAEGMLDQEDILNQAFIWSADALNIVWELPVLANNGFGAVAYQRLFNTQIANLLAGCTYLDRPVVMHGDDIMVKITENTWGKASVSITYAMHKAALGHTGINLNAGEKAPTCAYSTQLSADQVETIVGEIIQLFYNLNHDLFIATSKILI